MTSPEAAHIEPWRYVVAGAYAGCIFGFSVASFMWLNPYLSLMGALGAVAILVAIFRAVTRG